MTIICAGEKDMAIARSMGFNAITITGGKGNTNGITGWLTTSQAYKPSTLSLCKWTISISSYVSGNLSFAMNSFTGSLMSGVGTHEQYLTTVSFAHWGVHTVSGSPSYSIDDFIIKKVLTPSNQGLLLQAAPTVDAGFLYNLASYTYEIWS
jgi:hypothetical protein